MAYDTHANGSWFDETSLVAYYKLEDVNDSGPSGYTLTNAGTTTFVAGKISNCANFVRTSNQYLYVMNGLGISGGLCTISCWYYPVSPNEGEFFGLVIVRDDASTYVWYRIGYYKSSGTTALYAYRTRSNIANTGVLVNGILPTGVWYNLIITYDNTNVRFYRNGVLLGSPTAASGNGTTDGLGSSTIIGAHTLTSADCTNGKIDEVLIFNRVWTAAEVAKYYENSKGQFLGQVAF